MSQTPASRQDVNRLFKDVSDHTMLAILESGATRAQLEEVSLWMAQENDVLGEARRPLVGIPAQVLDWLERDQLLDDEEQR